MPKNQFRISNLRIPYLGPYDICQEFYKHVLAPGWLKTGLSKRERPVFLQQLRLALAPLQFERGNEQGSARLKTRRLGKSHAYTVMRSTYSLQSDSFCIVCLAATTCASKAVLSTEYVMSV